MQMCIRDRPQKAGQFNGLLRGDDGPLQLGAVFGAHKPAQAAAGEVHPGQRGAEEVGLGQGAVLQRQLLQPALGEPAFARVTVCLVYTSRCV